MHAATLRRAAALGALCLIAAGCRTERVSAREDEPRPRATPALSGDQERDRAALVRMEDEAKALARTAGCADAGSCAVAAVGAKGCGGPRYYISYCRTSTDVAALETRLAELASFERAFNERYQVASTCDMVLEPTPELHGGRCGAGPPR